VNKISETLSILRSGARNNKYRIIYPLFGKEIDILCHTSSNPGREIGTVDVFLKGRKYIMAGDMADDGVWALTIYNTQDFLVRSFFLKVIAGIQNFNAPLTLDDSAFMSEFFTGFNYSNNSNYGDSSSYNFLAEIGKDSLSDSMEIISNAYNQMYSNWNTVNNYIYDMKEGILNSTGADGKVFTTSSSNQAGATYKFQPWYMSDIIIQQLDHNDLPVTTTTLHNAFITNVGGIDYTDEAGDISTTELTFAYSGKDYSVDGFYQSY